MVPLLVSKHHGVEPGDQSGERPLAGPVRTPEDDERSVQTVRYISLVSIVPVSENVLIELPAVAA